MDVAVFAIVLVGLTAFVAAPLYAREPLSRDPGGTSPHARREALASALSDLEVDRASGLLTESDYRRERTDLEAEIAALDTT